MSHSTPSAPSYLHVAIRAVERVLTERYPDPLTARQIAQELREEGFEWPLPRGYYHSKGRTLYRESDTAEPTTERVRRVCELTANRTVIAVARPYTTPKRYTIYPWAIERERGRLAKR